MKELYKVRKIILSLLDQSSHMPYKDIKCEFGRIIDDGGMLFLETHIFDDVDFSLFNYESLGSQSCATMLSFDNVEIEIPFMAYMKKSTKENKVTFKCFDYITVHEEDVIYMYQKEDDEHMLPTQLLRIDFWGLDLIIPPRSLTSLMVYDAPFDIQLQKDKDTSGMFATFPINQNVAHNTLTLELFQLFRDSLVGYLSIINGAQVQITKEYYNGFFRIFSYNRIENTRCSYYACGNAKLFKPNRFLFEFDNYVRWNHSLDFNKFIYHLCSAQRLLYCEDSSFILILALEGLCKRYIDIHKEGIIPKTIIPQDSFEGIKKEFNEIIKNHHEIPLTDVTKFKEAINRLNNPGLATYKFSLILDELNIQKTKEIKNIIRKVRSTLVHEAVLKDYYDYVLLSELIREIILRLINSKVERYSESKGQAIKGTAPNLSFSNFIAKNNLDVEDAVFFSEHDKHALLRITEDKKIDDEITGNDRIK